MIDPNGIVNSICKDLVFVLFALEWDFHSGSIALSPSKVFSPVSTASLGGIWYHMGNTGNNCPVVCVGYPIMIPMGRVDLRVNKFGPRGGNTVNYISFRNGAFGVMSSAGLVSMSGAVWIIDPQILGISISKKLKVLGTCNSPA